MKAQVLRGALTALWLFGAGACSGDLPADEETPDTTDDDDGTAGSDAADDDTASPDDDKEDDDAAPETPMLEPDPEIDVKALQCEASVAGAPTLRLLTRAELTSTINSVFPEISGKWNNSLAADSRNSLGFDNWSGNQLGAQQAGKVSDTAESIGGAVASSVEQLLPCATAADRACAESYVQSYGKRLFRRPLTTTERERYLSLFDSALSQTDFATGIKFVTAALVQSPNTLYRSELGKVEGDKRVLSPYEVATALAYTFTGTAPSDELLAQAEEGELDPAVSARELLATDAGSESLLRFFDGYMNFRYAGTIEKSDADTDGISYSQIKEAMVDETRAFLKHVLIEEGGSVADLLTSPVTFPSKELASYYRLPEPDANGAVTRPEGRGIGLLAQGAFLASKASPDSSSPTRRGVFAFERLLCQARPPVPDQVPQLPSVEQTGDMTTRQRYEDLHAAGGVCAACHAAFDPMGYAFEHYDQAGRYRDNERGLDIDTTGKVDLPIVGKLSFDGQEDLMTQIAASPIAAQCLTAYLATYAFGTSQQCLGTHSAEGAAAGTLSVREAFEALATEPHFTERALK